MERWKRNTLKAVMAGLLLLSAYLVLLRVFEVTSTTARECIAKGGEYHTWFSRDYRAPKGASCVKVTITEIK